MKKSVLVVPIALVALATWTLALDVQARGGGRGGLAGQGMSQGSDQGYKQMEGQGTGERGNGLGTLDPSKSQVETRQKNRSMEQNRVRKQDGTGAMEQRRETHVGQI